VSKMVIITLKFRPWFISLKLKTGEKWEKYANDPLQLSTSISTKGCFAYIVTSCNVDAAACYRSYFLPISCMNPRFINVKKRNILVP